MKELNNLVRYARETFALLPTQEELLLRFPHKNGCVGTSPFTKTTEFVGISSGEPWIGSVFMRSYFLQCDECHVKREYRPASKN